jgi:hypothetical protein
MIAPLLSAACNAFCAEVESTVSSTSGMVVPQFKATAGLERFVAGGYEAASG